MERVLLVNPWIYDFKAFDFWMKPLGLLYIAAYLREAGYEIELIDCLDRYHPVFVQRVKKLPKVDEFGRGKFYCAEIEKPPLLKNINRRYKRYGMPPEVLSEILEKVKTPNYILVTSIMTYWYLGVFDTVKILKRHFSKTPIFLGGIYPTLCPEHSQRFAPVDSVLPGRAEIELPKIFSQLKPKPFFELPFPNFDLYSKLDYVCIITSVGCRFHCSYCAVPNLYPKFTYRSQESVLSEIEHYNLRKIKNIAFYDDALLLNPNFKRILDGLIERKFKINFHTPNGLHPRFIDSEIAEKLFKAGFKTIYLSLETTDPKIQNATGGKVLTQEFLRAHKFLKDAGFKNHQIHTYLLIGLPEQSIESIKDGIDMLSGMKTTIHLAEFSPIPGTKEFLRWKDNNKSDPLFHNNTIFPLLDKKEQRQMNEIKKYLNQLRQTNYNKTIRDRP